LGHWIFKDVSVSSSNPEYPEEVKRMRSLIWSIYHAIEEGDWERLLKPNIFDEPRFREAVSKAERYFAGRYGISLETYIKSLRQAVEEKDATSAYKEMVEILLCLEPAVPWIH
jgi:hypothetical protein